MEVIEMKRLMLALALLALTASVATAQSGESMPLWKLKLQTTLAQRISLSVQSVPLTDVVEILRGMLKANIVLDPADTGSGNTLITLDLKDVRVDTILNWTTKQAGLAYVLADEVIYISTPERVRDVEPRRLVAYEVTDVVITPQILAAGNTNNNTNDNNEQDNGNNNGNTGVDGGNDLITLITTFTGPENWDQARVLVTTNNNNSANDNASEENRF
jgi:hypothetical protein